MSDTHGVPERVIYIQYPFCYSEMPHNSGEYLHTLIEALQLSFADTQWYCADPGHTAVPTDSLLSKTYAAQRRALMKPKRWACVHAGGVYLCVPVF